MIKITYHEAARALNNLYRSEEYIGLQKKLAKQTYLSCISKNNSETVYSSFISWILDNKIFQQLPDSPLHSLLRLLASNAINQCLEENTTNNEVNINPEKLKNLMDRDTLEAILSNDNILNYIEVETEVPTVRTKNTDKKGRVDLVITFTLNKKTIDKNNSKKIRIILENKVYSAEHSGQCQTYFNFFNNDKINYNRGVENIFCYLSIEKPEKLSDNEHFILITYQELLDCVLTPLMNYKSSFSAETQLYLTDFINTITMIKMDDKPQIALDEETRNLLRNFYEKNEALIKAAILESDDEDAKAAVNKSTSGSVSYIIDFIGAKGLQVVGHQELVYAILRQLAWSMSSNDLIKLFHELGNIFSSKNLISGNQWDFYDNKGTYRGLYKKDRKTIVCSDNQPIYCSGQFTTENIQKFIDFVNNHKELNIQIAKQ